MKTDDKEISDLTAVRMRLEVMLSDFFREAHGLLCEIDTALECKVIPMNKEKKVTVVHSDR